MKINEEVNSLFLKGGKVVHSETYTAETYLIRMPQEHFIKDVSEEWGIRYFEYVWIQNYLNNDELHIGGHLNSTLVGAKKEMSENHSEHCSFIYRKELA